MTYLKQRLFALIIAFLGAALLYHSHYDVRHSGSYNLKETAFAPFLIVAGIFLLVFPQYFGKPETNCEKAVVLGVFGIGMLLGLYNWYLIDPTMFPF